MYINFEIFRNKKGSPQILLVFGVFGYRKKKEFKFFFYTFFRNFKENFNFLLY